MTVDPEQYRNRLTSAGEGYDYQIHKLAPGVKLHIQPTDRFKTVSVLHVNANPLAETSAENSLIPMVLRDGCSGFPSQQSIALELQRLHGASISVNIKKFGLGHLQTSGLSYISPHYLNEDRTEKDALDLFFRMLTRPRKPDDPSEEDLSSPPGSFHDPFFKKEKKNLIALIDSIRENRQDWAVLRALHHLFKDHPYRFPRYGERERVAGLQNKPLFSHYRKNMESQRMHTVVTGNVEPDDIRSTFEEHFVPHLPERNPVKLNPIESVESSRDEPLEVTEESSGQQGWLVIGYQTGITLGTPDLYALIMTSSLLGGHPHSLLFRNVREELGLAYSIGTNLDRTVGLMLITAGINPENKDETIHAIDETLEQVRNGNVSEQDINITEQQLLEQLVSLQDNPTGKAGAYIERYLTNRVESLPEIANNLMEVGKEDIQRVATSLSPDIHYLLR